MWNPLYGTRGGVPYGGACLPKDTVAFLQFARERGMEHQLLEATISVNRRLAASIPAAPSADKVDEVREAMRQPDAATIENLTLEVGSTPAIVL
jgi:UDPglucose 6-dehydrogenase